jgi:hypothetical protein
MEIFHADLVPSFDVLSRPIALGEAHLAGAGAIGNGFLGPRATSTWLAR